MLSIIICSINPSLLSDLSENIDSTIGIPYEIIPFDNRTASLGICKVYNKCASEAKYPNLLFLHEDVKFYGQDWGINLIKLLNNPEIGLVGITGAVFKASAPTSWVSVPKEYYRSNQYFSQEECLLALENVQDGFDEVVVVDGMFLAMTDNIWEVFKFNEALVGFHLYDLDLSYRTFKSGLKIVIPKKIILQHFSRGSFNLNWTRTSMEWHKGKKLPIYTTSITDKEVMKLEKENNAQFLAYLVKEGYLSSSWLKLWIDICIKNRKVHLGILTQIFRKYKQIITHNSVC